MEQRGLSIEALHVSQICASCLGVPMRSRIRFSRAATTALLSATALLFTAMIQPAAAGFIPVPTTPSPHISVNNVVRAVAIGEDVAFIGGDFTSATGTNGTFARSGLVAFDLGTGNVLPFRADSNARVRALALSGNSLYAGGDFTAINGTSRGRIAELDSQTGAPRSDFRVNATGAVRALAVTAGRLYAGGQFGNIGGVAQARVAAIDTSTRTVDATFNPVLDATVQAVAVAPGGDRVYVGGDFATVNGAARPYLAALTSQGQPVAVPFSIASGYVVLGLDMNDDGSWLFAAVGGTGNQVAAYNTTNGARLWRQRADGDVQAVTYWGGNVYFGFHEGFNGNANVRLLAADADTGDLEPAFQPSVDSFWGIRALDANAHGLLAGGEFTTVSGVPAGRAAFFDAAKGPTPPQVTTLVASHDTWKYFDGPTVATGWAQPAFDDGSWAAGSAQLGYGDGDESTVIGSGPDPSNRYRAAYFRKSFEWDGHHSVASLIADLVADDGAVAYLNGQEVVRDNMPTGAITNVTYAASNRSGTAENTSRSFTIDPALLKVGTNVITVEVHQDYRASSDLSMELRLRAAN